jgi:hypothetical protein
MGSETDGGVLDIHLGNKIDVDICRIGLGEENTYGHCKETVWSYPVDYLLGYNRLYVYHTYGNNEDPPGFTTSPICGCKRGQLVCIQIVLLQPL